MSELSPTRTVNGKIWVNMHQRCSNPKNTRYADYGGRGITVCKQWSDKTRVTTGAFRGGNGAIVPTTIVKGLVNFLTDMGERPAGYTLDRINNDKGYSPENCRWATEQEQQLNKRVYRTNTSGHKGIAWYKPYSKWRVQLKRNGVSKHGGYFDNLEDAVTVNNKLRKEM